MCSSDLGRPFTGVYRRAHGLPAASQIQRSLAGLMRKELVGKREDGSYAIVEPFLIDWLLRNSER